MFPNHFKSSTVWSVLLLLLIILCVVSCAAPAPASQPAVDEVHLINPMGPAVIPVAGIAGGQVTGDVKIDVQYWKTVDEAVGLLSGGDAEFAVLPITTGINMNAAGIDIVLLGVHEWKVFYLIASDGNDFVSWDSLRGKTIYTPEAKGQTVDVLTRYALSRANITPDEDVTFVYAPVQEIVALFSNGKIDYAALPEPYVTVALASGKGKIALDYQDYWSEVSNTQLGIPIAGLFVSKTFYNEHPDVAQSVAETIAASTQWANDNPEAAVQASSNVLPLEPKVIQAALHRIRFEYIPAAKAKEEVLIFLETMRDTYPDGIKIIPDGSFFIQ